MSSEDRIIYECDSNEWLSDALVDPISKDEHFESQMDDAFNNLLPPDEISGHDNYRKKSSSSYNSDLDERLQMAEDSSTEDQYANDSKDCVLEAMVLEDTFECFSNINENHYQIDESEDVSKSIDIGMEAPVVFEEPEKEVIKVEYEPKDNLNVTDEKPKVNKRFFFQPPSGSLCEVCAKTVYPMEKVMMDMKCYHKGCFKCCKCGKSMNPTVVTMFNNNVFCKPHYIELFRKRGRYDDINAENREDCDQSNVASSSYFVTTSKIINAEKNEINRNNNINSKDVRSNSEGYGLDTSRDRPRGTSDINERALNNEVESTAHVASIAKAWQEGRVSNAKNWNRDHTDNNNESNERRSIDLGSRVKNLKAMFESNQ